MFDTINAYIVKNLDIHFLQQNGFKPSSKKDEFNQSYSKKTKYLIIKYFPLRQMLKVEVSLPRLIHPTNAFMVSEKDLIEIAERFKSHLLNETGYDLPNLLLWTVTRVDYSYNFFVGNPADKQIYLSAFKLIRLSRYKFKEYESSATWVNNSVRLSIYCKATEMSAKNKKLLVDDNIKRILRIEISYKSRAIRNKFKDNSKESVTLGKILKDSLSKDALEGIIKRAKLIKEPSDFNTGIVRIKERFSPIMAARLIDFVTNIRDKGYNETRQLYANGTFYKYQKELIENNIGLIFTNEEHSCNKQI